MSNSDRFPSTSSLFGVYLMMEALRARIAGLPEMVEREGREYVLLEETMLLTEARHLLFTVRTMALHQPDNFDSLIEEIIDLEDEIDVAFGDLPNHPSIGGTRREWLAKEAAAEVDAAVADEPAV